MSWLLFLFSIANAAPVEITVTDTMVVKVILDCGGETREFPVRNGKVSVPDVPGTCNISWVRMIGAINQPGTYTCSREGCTMEQVAHKQISDAAGRVNVVITSDFDASQVELNCPSGRRERAAIEERVVSFENVNESDCSILFKGGAPAKYRPVSPGTYSCQLNGATAVCTQN